MKSVTYDPLAAESATPQNIDAVRVREESKPIALDGYLFACRQIDLWRMQAVGMAGKDQTLVWQLADNSALSLTGQELLAYRQKLLVALGQRMLVLHDKVQSLKKSTNVSLRELEEQLWSE